MDKSKDSFGGGFLYAEDLIRNGDFQPVTVTIAEVSPPNTMKSADKKLIDKHVLRFEKASKLLVLYKTNESVLKYICGDQPGDAWVGKKITLQTRDVDSFGTKVAAIRVIPPDGMSIRKKLAERLGTKASLKN